VRQLWRTAAVDAVDADGGLRGHPQLQQPRPDGGADVARLAGRWAGGRALSAGAAGALRLALVSRLRCCLRPPRPVRSRRFRRRSAASPSEPSVHPPPPESRSARCRAPARPWRRGGGCPGRAPAQGGGQRSGRPRLGGRGPSPACSRTPAQGNLNPRKPPPPRLPRRLTWGKRDTEVSQLSYSVCTCSSGAGNVVTSLRGDSVELGRGRGGRRGGAGRGGAGGGVGGDAQRLLGRVRSRDGRQGGGTPAGERRQPLPRRQTRSTQRAAAARRGARPTGTRPTARPPPGAPAAPRRTHRHQTADPRPLRPARRRWSPAARAPAPARPPSTPAGPPAPAGGARRRPWCRRDCRAPARAPTEATQPAATPARRKWVARRAAVFVRAGRANRDWHRRVCGDRTARRAKRGAPGRPPGAGGAARCATRRRARPAWRVDEANSRTAASDPLWHAAVRRRSPSRRHGGGGPHDPPTAAVRRGSPGQPQTKPKPPPNPPSCCWPVYRPVSIAAQKETVRATPEAAPAPSPPHPVPPPGFARGRGEPPNR
jgi:hypothetical protein